jgi:hypothetical protein
MVGLNIRFLRLAMNDQDLLNKQDFFSTAEQDAAPGT